MLKILLLIWIALYLYLIIEINFKIKKLNFVINALSEYIQSGSHSTDRYGSMVKSDCYKEKLSVVLRNYPIIMSFFKVQFDGMAYGKSDFKNYKSACYIYNELLMTRNYYLKLRKFRSLPIDSLKKIIFFPGYVLRKIGAIKTDKYTRLISLTIWIIRLMVEYQDEIKKLIALISKHI